MKNQDNEIKQDRDISEPALEKHSDKSAGKAIIWTIILATIVLGIILLLFFAKHFKNF